MSPQARRSKAPATTKRRTSLRDAQKEFTRRRLLDEGRRLFEEKGYSPLTLDEVVDAAGMSRATFYLHFRSKVELLIAIRQEVLPSIREYWLDLDKALLAGTPEALRAVIEQGMAWFEQHGRILPAWDEAAVLEETYVESSRGTYDQLLDTLSEYFGRFSAAELPKARMRVMILVLQMERVFVRWTVQDSIRADRDLIIDTMAEIWSAALLPIPPKKTRARKR